MVVIPIKLCATIILAPRSSTMIMHSTSGFHTWMVFDAQSPLLASTGTEPTGALRLNQMLMVNFEKSLPVK